MSSSRRNVLLAMTALAGLWLSGCGSDSPVSVVKSFAQAAIAGDVAAARKLASDKFQAGQGSNFEKSIKGSSSLFKAMGGATGVEILKEEELGEGRVEVFFTVVIGGGNSLTFSSDVVKNKKGDWLVDDWNQRQGARK
jgi:hypothetical protein